jgi:cytochrome P450
MLHDAEERVIRYDPYDEAMLDDPWDTYRRLREEAPAHYIEQFDCWVLSRFEDIVAAGMDREHYSVRDGTTSGHLMAKGMLVDNRTFFLQDPPEHTPHRALLAPCFRPRPIARREAEIRAIAERHAAALAEQGGGDAVQDLAVRVATDVACALIGIPRELGPELQKSVAVFQRFFHHRPGEKATVADRDAAAGSMLRTIADLVGERARSPEGDDVISVMLRGEVDGERLSDFAICANTMNLFIGAVETVPKHFGSLVYWLAKHPGQRVRVAADPALLPKAVEEALRFDAPTHILGRRILHDVEWHGQKLSAGQGLLLLYASGNRDEREFENPDVFDVTRDVPRNLAFGFGIHLCMGLHVARLESRLMLEQLLRHFPDYALVEDEVVRCRLAGIHGYDAVPIRA